MDTRFDRLHTLFEGVPDRLYNKKAFVWILFLLSFGIIISGIPRLIVDMSYSEYFEKDDPVTEIYEQFRDVFGSQASVYIVYKPKDNDVFSEASLSVVKEMQSELLDYTLNLKEGETSRLEHIIEVNTIVNASYLEVTGDTLISREFIGEKIPITQTDREKIRAQALVHKDFPFFYVSKDSQYGGIFIRTDYETLLDDEGDASEGATFEESSESFKDESDDRHVSKYKRVSIQEFAKFNRELNEIIFQPKYTDKLDLYPSGNIVLQDYFNYLAFEEGFVLNLVSYLVIIVVLIFLFRSISGALWPMLITIITISMTFGIVSWIGIVMSQMIQLLISLLMVVSVADSIHILSGYLFFRRKNMDHRSAIRAAYKKSGFACLLTSITTMLGMLSLTIVPIPPIRTFGVAAAIGVGLAFLITIFILPLMLNLLHPISKKREIKIRENAEALPLVQRLLLKVNSLVSHHPVRIVVLFACIALVCLYGISNIRVESDTLRMFKKGHVILKAFNLVDKEMGGSQNLEILMEFQTQDALKDPAVLDAMDTFQNLLSDKYADYITKTNSLVNVAKNSYQALNNNREDMYVIPAGKQLLHQTLFLFDTANPEDRSQLADDNYSIGRISIRVKYKSSSEYVEIMDDIEEDLERIMKPLQADYPEFQVKITGALNMIMRMVERLSWSQIKSFGLALTTISVVLIFIFGSFKAGAVSIVPNVFPIILTFGLMGLLGIPLDINTLLVAPILIGIAADDTIHFLTHYKLEYMQTGSISKAIQLTLAEVGQALCFTTAILCCGGLVWIFSNSVIYIEIGFLFASGYLAALLADIILLPALCKVLNIKFSISRNVASETVQN